MVENGFWAVIVLFNNLIFLLGDVDHYDLAAWTFEVLVLGFVVVVCLLLLAVFKLYQVHGELGVLAGGSTNGNGKKRPKTRVKTVKVKDVVKETKNKPVYRTDCCSEHQFFGFLRDRPNGFSVPANCEKCPSVHKCMSRRGLKSLLRRVWGVFFIFLVFGAMFGSVAVYAADGEDVAFTLVGEADWVHVSVNGDSVGSVALERFGDNVQLIFYAFKDSGLSFDRFVIEANVSYTDPFEKFSVLWTGEFSGTGKILLSFSSIYGQTSTVVESFSGEVPHYGRPGTTYKKNVITGEGEIFDVFSALDNDYICSFEWRFVSSGSNESEGVAPNLIVYKPDGSEYDNKFLSATGLALVEFYDQVGFMVDSMGTDYVKWVLYSGDDFQVRANQGFGEKPLPSFRVEPVGLRVESGDSVSVFFLLPDDVSEYEGSWNNREEKDLIELLVDETYSDGTHEIVFKVLDSAKNKKITIQVKCEKYGTVYASSAQIEVSPGALEYLVPVLVLFAVFVVVFVLCVRWLIIHKREPPMPIQVMELVAG
jgi:hypothetical protein